MNPLRTAGDSILNSFNIALGQLASFLPTFIGAVLVLAVGWWLAGIIGKLVYRALVAVGLEKAVAHSGFGQFLQRADTQWTTSKIVAELAKWFIRLIFIQGAANVLGMPQVTQILNQIILYLPNVVVAIVILVVGAMLARFLSHAVQGSVAELQVANAPLFALITRYSVLGFAIIAAINQLGIASVVVNTLLIGLVASISLAIGLAFGLGGKDVASRITESWYEKGKKARLTDVSAESVETVTGPKTKKTAS